MDAGAIKRAIDETAGAPRGDPPTLTDACPVGAFTLAGHPARVFAAADHRILQMVVASAGADDPVTDGELPQLLLYCALHVSRADIRRLWREARNPGEFRERVFDWATTIPASEYMRMQLDAGPLLDEFARVQRVVGEAEDTGNAGRPATPPPAQTGLPSSESTSAETSACHE